MKLYVIGIGPGEEAQLTEKARRTLLSCDVIAGYHVYVDLIKHRFADKLLLTTPMTKEADRCRMAFGQAASGKTVGLVCSGDPGVYGLAGLCLELAEEYPQVSVEIVPGVTAALSGAAGLGAPLGHDFAVISLSDRLTAWESIVKRLRAAAEADFVICIYNPASHARKDYLRAACDILLAHKSPGTVCGCAR
jgi:precorrin-3B C17-methyltransferase